jgi:hypothetical protein
MKTEMDKFVNLVDKFFKATSKVPATWDTCNVNKVSKLQEKILKRIDKLKSKSEDSPILFVQKTKKKKKK